jgi:hypothetical protein
MLDRATPPVPKINISTAVKIQLREINMRMREINDIAIDTMKTILLP